MKNCERSKIQVENLSSSPVRTSHLQHSELRVDSLRVIASLPDTLRAEVFTLFSHIQAGVPGLVHCWGDESNVCGGLAAVLSGVPSIVFSARGVSPDRYPPTGRDTHFDLYQTLMKSSAAHWLATSRDGASSYVQWLSLDPARVSLVRLGIPQSDQDPFTALSAFRESPWQERSSERERTLAALEIPASAVVVGGVFELVDSARPLRFVRLIFELHRQNPNLFGIIAGAGALESHVREEIEQLKLSKVCFVLPADEDCNLARSSFDLFVHCGSVSDLSSTFMEAASQGIPVFVPTGDPLASPLQQDRSGIFSIDSGGVTAEFSKLTATILHLTQNAELRRSVGETGKALARDSFSSKTSTEQVLSLYRALGFDVELALQRELQAEDSVTDARLAKASIS